MRRLAMVAITLVVAASAAGAVAAQRAKPRIMAIGGLNFARLTGRDAGSGIKTRTGVHGGALVTVALAPSIAVQSGLFYSQEGTSGDAGYGITVAIKIDYLELPFYLKVHTTLQGTTPLRPYLLAGPAVGFKVHCRVEASNGSNSAGADCTDPAVGLDVKGTQFGLHFGGGVEIGRVLLGGRYQLGLSSIDNSGANADVKNSVFAITAGFGF